MIWWVYTHENIYEQDNRNGNRDNIVEKWGPSKGYYDRIQIILSILDNIKLQNTVNDSNIQKFLED